MIRDDIGPSVITFLESARVPSTSKRTNLSRCAITAKESTTVPLEFELIHVELDKRTVSGKSPTWNPLNKRVPDLLSAMLHCLCSKSDGTNSTLQDIGQRFIQLVFLLEINLEHKMTPRSPPRGTERRASVFNNSPLDKWVDESKEVTVLSATSHDPRHPPSDAVNP